MLEKLFGANYRTTLLGFGSACTAILAAVAAAPYELGEVAVLIPPAWKEKIFTASVIATFILRVIKNAQTKDKQVTGGTQSNDTAK